MSIDRSGPSMRRRLTAAVAIAAVATGTLVASAGSAAAQVVPAEAGPAGKWCRTAKVPPPYEDLPPCYVGAPQAPDWDVSVEFEGAVGRPSTGSITATGTPKGETVVYTVEDPAKLPPGIAISKDGKISGTPTKAGRYPVPVKICAGYTCMRVVVTIVIVEGPTSPEMEIILEGFTGYVGHKVTGRFVLKGADYDNVTFTVLDESALPPGVTLNKDGSLSGVPAKKGSFTVPVEICKGTACGRTTLTITIEDPPYDGGTETTTTEVDATVKITESVETNLALPLEDPGQRVTVVNPEGLPPGISIDAAGRITGTATEMGTYKVTLKVSGGGGSETWNVTFEVCACAAGVSAYA